MPPPPLFLVSVEAGLNEFEQRYPVLEGKQLGINCCQQLAKIFDHPQPHPYTPVSHLRRLIRHALRRTTGQ